jgi:transposase
MTWPQAPRQAEASDVPELAGFAAGLRKDWAAASAGLTLPWSSGTVEAHVSRIKMVKRQMYGRAEPDLLRKRVLLADPHHHPKWARAILQAATTAAGLEDASALTAS